MTLAMRTDAGVRADRAPMVRKIIRVDGTEEPIEASKSVVALAKRIGAELIDTVQLRHLGSQGWVMLVDDTGLIDGKPINETATALYHCNCKPGTTHPICGDVVIVLDEDFA